MHGWFCDTVKFQIAVPQSKTFPSGVLLWGVFLQRDMSLQCIIFKISGILWFFHWLLKQHLDRQLFDNFSDQVPFSTHSCAELTASFNLKKQVFCIFVDQAWENLLSHHSALFLGSSKNYNNESMLWCQIGNPVPHFSWIQCRLGMGLIFHEQLWNWNSSQIWHDVHVHHSTIHYCSPFRLIRNNNLQLEGD